MKDQTARAPNRDGEHLKAGKGGACAPLPDLIEGERKPGVRGPKPRVSAKMRHAMQLRLSKGLAWKECARVAGLSEAAIHAARAKPHVKAYWNELEALYQQDLEWLQKANKLRAHEVTREVMDDEKDNRIRLKAVELVTGGSRSGTQINVQTNVHNDQSGRYAYVRPGQQMVDITPLDTQSGNPDDETPEK